MNGGAEAVRVSELEELMLEPELELEKARRTGPTELNMAEGGG
jgi:hypothetical protein